MNGRTNEYRQSRKKINTLDTKCPIQTLAKETKCRIKFIKEPNMSVRAHRAGVSANCATTI